MKQINILKRELSNAVRVGYFLAVRQLRRSGKGTTALIIFIMVLTFLNLVVVSGLLVGIVAGSFKQFRESYSGDVIITAADGKDHIEHSSEVIALLAHHPRVNAYAPRRGVNASVLGTLSDLPKKNERPNQITARISGIDPEKEEAVTNFSRFVVRGRPLDPNAEGSLLIGSNLLKKYSSFADANIPGLVLLEDVDVGSRVRVSMIRPDGKIIQKDMVVQGIVKSKVDEISTRMFMLDKELKRMLPVRQEEVQEIAVRTDAGYAPTLVKEIRDTIGADVARVQTTDEAIPTFLRDIESTMTVLGNTLSSFALIVAAITVFIVIFINAVTKRKYIGIMKGIGISPFAIQCAYVFQALFYGVIGSIIGLTLTFAVLRPYFLAHPINFPFSDGILVATPEGALVRVLILLGVTLCAGFLPATLVVRKNTLDAILGR